MPFTFQTNRELLLALLRSALALVLSAFFIFNKVSRCQIEVFIYPSHRYMWETSTTDDHEAERAQSGTRSAG